MARMRVLLDRQGNYISPAAQALRRADPMREDHPPEPAVLEAPRITRRVVRYRCERDTWGKSMTAWELARLFDLSTGGWRMSATPEQFATLPADLRQHFMPVWEEVEE